MLCNPVALLITLSCVLCVWFVIDALPLVFPCMIFGWCTLDTSSFTLWCVLGAICICDALLLIPSCVMCWSCLFSSLVVRRCTRRSYAVRLHLFFSYRMWGLGWVCCVGAARLLRYLVDGSSIDDVIALCFVPLLCIGID